MSTMDALLRQIESVDEAAWAQEAVRSDALQSDETAIQQERKRQFRLTRIQLKDWGTYHGLLSLDVPRKGQLVVGHSGSGKSTIFDAHSVLLTPPQRLRLNQASRDSGKNADDRSVMNYVRGVWGTAQGEDGRGVAKLLRSGTTWSAIAEVYRNEEGKVVTLAHVYWVRGASNELHRRYLLAEREFDIRELNFFAEADLDTMRLHRTLKGSGVEVFEAFSRYMAGFTKALAIRDDMALLLLHKTQSTKSVDSVTAFLREFMLDEPQTFEVAKNVVSQFQNLNEAYSDWETATQQRDVLMPAREAQQQRHVLSLALERCREIANGVPLFATPLGLEVHDRAIQQAGASLRSKQTLLEIRAEKLREAETRHAQAIRVEALGGGDDLRRLEAELERAQTRVADAVAQCRTLEAACASLARAIPATDEEFAALHADAQRAKEAGVRLDTTRLQEAAGVKAALTPERETLQRQLVALEKAPRSNVPVEQQDIRTMLAQALDVELDELPFAAELMSVLPREKRWQGALERLMSGFGMTMLLPSDLFEDVRRFVDRNHLRGRLTYRPVRPVQEPARARLPDNAAGKIEVLQHAFHRWLSNEIQRQFDYACVESADEMGAHPRALSLSGQIKRAGENYLKDDRYALDQKGRWVLGTDTTQRAQLLHAQLDSVNQKLDAAEKAIRAHNEEASALGRRLESFVAICAMAWNDLDQVGAERQVLKCEKELADAQSGNPELEKLRGEVRDAKGAQELAQSQWAAQKSLVTTAEAQIRGWETERARLAALPSVALTPLQAEEIAKLRERRAVESTPETYDRELAWLKEKTYQEVTAIETQLAHQGAEIVRALSVFCAKSEWRAATKGHDPVLDSYEFFDQYLTNLLVEGVSRTWERFLAELQEHNVHQIALLSQSLTTERADMARRLEAVNASLERTAYNERTHLQLHRLDCEPEDSKVFRRELTVAMSEVINVDGPQAAKVRFERLRAIAQRLGSDKSEDIRWRTKVLDVRQHVQFDAHEILDGTSQIEQVYSGSDGRSGGQKQKLAATCMAAALRYQLAHPGGTVPQFATVVVDEAFDRSDPDFTEAALNVFQELGFQIIVATPGKMVQTIEPYVGGAVWVYARRGDRSNAVALRYDGASGRIDYSPMQAGEERATGALAG
jgi:uncharacterized protein YPO0396